MNKIHVISLCSQKGLDSEGFDDLLNKSYQMKG